MSSGFGSTEETIIPLLRLALDEYRAVRPLQTEGATPTEG